MNIIKLSGGIGNQLSQLSLLFSMQKNGLEVKIDESFYSNHNGITRIDKILKLNLEYATQEEIESYGVPKRINILNRILIKLSMLIGLRIQRLLRNNRFYFHQGRFNLYKKYWTKVDNVYFDGTFINRELIENSIEYFRSKFDRVLIPQKLSDIVYSVSKSNSVALHIRRGDYLELSESGFFTLRDDYYSKAIRLFQNEFHTPYFYVFSQTEINNFVPLAGKTFQNLEIDVEYRDFYELLVMTKCKNFIIANSTFSLWASYLSKNDDKIIIGPNRWMRQHYATTQRILPLEAIIINL
jgi:hypothetical protein